MRKIKLLLVFVIGMLALQSNQLLSQSNNPFKLNLPGDNQVVNRLEPTDSIPSTKVMDEMTFKRSLLYSSHTAGDELIIASQHYYTGLIVSVMGIGFTALTLTKDQKRDQDPIIYGGTLIMVVGAAIMIESKIHIRRAGILLNSNGLGIRLPLNK